MHTEDEHASGLMVLLTGLVLGTINGVILEALWHLF